MKEVAAVLDQVSSSNCYDGFIHYASLEAWRRETHIPPANWKELLASWPYDPITFMSESNRGNCADFAAHTVHELGKHGIASYVAGVLPDNYYSTDQQMLLGYQHTVVLGEHAHERFLCEPGWNSPQPLPIQRRLAQKLGKQVFHTVTITDESLVQHYFRGDGSQGTRMIDLRPLESRDLSKVTKGAMRLPTRRMSLTATLDNDPEQNHILYDTRSGLLKSPLPYLPERFHPLHISNKANHKLSAAFGFDVKEELLACYAIKEALPPAFWVV